MNDWISVEDRLPEYGEVVLVYGTDADEQAADIFIGYRQSTDRHGENWHEDGRLGSLIFNVTHWRPMVEPPK